MIARINRLLLLFIIVGSALWVVTMNRALITVSLSPGTAMSATTGVVLIIVFGAGIFCASLIALFFGFKGYLRERKLHAREKIRLQFYRSMAEARSLLAGEEWQRAREEWEALIKKDPTDVIARVELSRCLEGAGESREGLKVLESARASAPQNREVLFRAAELNIVLGNKTAALDNLALILAQSPSRRAARLARRLSLELNRIEDAFEYHARLEALGEPESELETGAAELRYRQIMRDFTETPALLIEHLRELLRRHPTYTPALETLARQRASEGLIDEASALWLRAARASGEARFWEASVKQFMQQGQPEKALATARTAIKETSGLTRLRLHLLLARTLLEVSRSDEAKEALQSFKTIAADEQLEVGNELRSYYLGIEALCAEQRGDRTALQRSLRELTEASPTAAAPAGTKNALLHAPSPSLSTP